MRRPWREGMTEQNTREPDQRRRSSSNSRQQLPRDQRPPEGETPEQQARTYRGYASRPPGSRGRCWSLRPTAFLRGSTTDVAAQMTATARAGSLSHDGVKLNTRVAVNWVSIPPDGHTADRPSPAGSSTPTVYPPAPALPGEKRRHDPPKRHTMSKTSGAKPARTSEARPHVHRLAQRHGLFPATAGPRPITQSLQRSS